ncbi:HAD-like protein [Backusella circina FSU 941]|nr:HAD-like protein [Backusella circina FSU 941]
MKLPFIYATIVTTLFTASNIVSAIPLREKRMASCFSEATLTQYWIPKEGDKDMSNDGDAVTLSGTKNKKLIDNNGNTIAKVSKTTFDKFQMEGTGLLESGVMVNLGSDTDVFTELDRSENPYGLGSSKDASLEPWVSIASNDLEPGTTLYIKEMDGLKLPDGKKHNGCVRVDDKGWSLDECQIDFFVLQFSAYEDLRNVIPETVTVKEQDCKIQSYVTGAVKKWAVIKKNMPFVAFDLQGTLCNYEKVIQALEHVLPKTTPKAFVGPFFSNWYKTALLEYIAISQSGKYQSLLNVLRYTLPQLCNGLVEPTLDETDNIIQAFNDQVEPYKDVVKVMERLKREGWDIWILSNSGLDDTVHLLDRMKLLDFVGDNLLCCDELRLAKPHPKIYSELMRLAVHRTKRIESFYLISSYSWEIASAKNISLKTVFLNTNHKQMFPSQLYNHVEPDITAMSLIECTSKIIEMQTQKAFIYK